MEKSGEVLYLLIYAGGKSFGDNEEIPTRTHLQKEIFLLQRIYPFTEMKNKYNFIPLYYGPFSKELLSDLVSAIDNGLVSDTDKIQLTPTGFKYASCLWHNLSDDEKIILITTKEKFNRMKTEDLIDYIYSQYPKFSKKSALKKDVIDNYFDNFWTENNLSDEYFVEIVKKSRENNA